ncbi:MAG: glycosyl hydrolase family 18 protein [Lachnospiraceae bacterium]|jgi:spore germination protein YaaH|nr:glycosyl hydrolase family 18 protein [Lachnospiraceae bacterium]
MSGRDYGYFDDEDELDAAEEDTGYTKDRRQTRDSGYGRNSSGSGRSSGGSGSRNGRSSGSRGGYGSGSSGSWANDSRSRGTAGGRSTGGGYGRRTDSYGSSGRRRKKKRGFPWQLGVVLLIFVLLGAFALTLYQKRYSYSTVQADLNSYFGETDDASVVPVMLQNDKSDTTVRLFDGTPYMSIDAVQSMLNRRFYYGKEDNVVLYCLPDDVVTTTIGTSDWSTGSGTSTEKYMPARMDGETLYLALDYVKKFTNFSYQLYTDPNRMQIYTQWGDVNTAIVSKKTGLRTTGGVKSDVLTYLEKGAKVEVLETMENWSKVKADGCFIGYVENKVLKDQASETQTPVTDALNQTFTPNLLGTKVNMAWHNVASTGGNDTYAAYMANTKSLNVLSPTWYPLQDDAGDLDSYARQDYMDQAHAAGLKVWPVVDNFNNPDVNHNNFLAKQASRTHVIDQLMDEASKYGFDGINVDFEQIDPDYGQDFIEFVRELSIRCRKAKLTLSVDNYVTYDFNDYYHMDEQADFADYVVIMGYDEHYAGDKEAGSVADIDYVKYGIERALQEVPKDQLINGIPFYTRLWIEDESGLTSQSLDMTQAAQFCTDHGLTPKWDEKTCQNYVEATEGSKTYKMWLEDAESIQAKLSVMQAEGIAGVAEWKLSFETPDIWDVIASYMAQ